MDPSRLITVGLLLGQAMVLVCVVFVSAWFVVRLRVAQTALDDVAKRNADGVEKPTMPKAVLLMGLKGCDPRLSEGLRRLLNQDYGDYSVRIVIHDRTDPAWDVVAAVAASHTGPVSLEYEAYEPSQRHGIINATNAKVVQSMRRLPADVEIVAMADGDLVVERDWLRKLAQPLVDDPTCGAAFGLKWFAPYGSYWGTYVRYLWNAGAAPAMALGNMPWGGCCAIRGDVVRSAGVIDRWARIIALDAALPDVLRPLGMHAAFVPSLIVPNEEQCSLPFALNYIRRQLTWTRLYHPAWPVLFVGSLVLPFIVFLPPVVAVLFALNGHMPEAVCLALGCLVSFVASDFVRVRLDARVRRLNGSPQPPRSVIRHVQILATVYLTIAVHVAAVCLARFWPWLAWRGMLLEVRGAERIRVVRDGTSPTTITVNHSL